MIFDWIICILGIGFTIPAVISEISNFKYKEFNTWIRFLPQLMLFIALLLSLKKKLYIFSIISGIISLFGIYFLLIFNSQNSSYVICNELEEICVESNDIICVGDLLALWEAILYLLGLCLGIIGNTLLIRSIYLPYKSAKVSSDADLKEDN